MSAIRPKRSWKSWIVTAIDNPMRAFWITSGSEKLKSSVLNSRKCWRVRGELSAKLYSAKYEIKIDLSFPRLPQDEIDQKVNAYREKLTNSIWGEPTKDKFGRPM